MRRKVAILTFLFSLMFCVFVYADEFEEFESVEQNQEDNTDITENDNEHEHDEDFQRDNDVVNVDSQNNIFNDYSSSDYEYDYSDSYEEEEKIVYKLIESDLSEDEIRDILKEYSNEQKDNLIALFVNRSMSDNRIDVIIEILEGLKDEITKTNFERDCLSSNEVVSENILQGYKEAITVSNNLVLDSVSFNGIDDLNNEVKNLSTVMIIQIIITSLLFACFIAYAIAKILLYGL